MAQQLSNAKIAREQVESIRESLASLPSKCPHDQEIRLEFSQVRSNGTKIVQLAQLVIKSGARNALSGKMISELTEHLDELERWAWRPWVASESTPFVKEECHDEITHMDTDDEDCNCVAKCLLVRGHGNTFCSGSDLITVRSTTTNHDLNALHLSELMQFNFGRLAALPLVSVAFLEGYALGGGAEFALATDMRLMSENAYIGFVHAKNGICCGWGGGASLVRLVGRARALELMSSGRLVDATEALKRGLCEARANSLDEAIEFAAAHAIESRRTSWAVKALVATTSSTLAHELELERKLFAATWGKPAHLRALARNVKHNLAPSRQMESSQHELKE